jgi:5'-phosphate synthase pdxT subunit
MKIGVLALQGAVSEHLDMLGRVGAEGTAVKKTEQLADLDGLIIPGGESTTIGKLMRTFGFIEALRQFSAEGKPIFGTCAGAIIIADEIANQEEAHLGLMRMRVARNAFGRQRESFEADLKIKGMDEPFRAVFIRAPIIESVGEGVEVLAEINGQIVAARQGHLLACSFHPELTDDPRFHALFADMVKSSQSTNAAQQLS